MHPVTDLESWGRVDVLSAEVFGAFIRVLQLHRQHMFRGMSGHGVHPGQVFCLRLVDERAGITQRDLASELLLARPTVTKMLQALERAGAVERRPDEHDRRLTRVYLTPTGANLLEEVRAVAAEYIGQTIATLSENDRRELARLLGLLGDSMTHVVAGSGGGKRSAAAGGTASAKARSAGRRSV